MFLTILYTRITRKCKYDEKKNWNKSDVMYLWCTYFLPSFNSPFLSSNFSCYSKNMYENFFLFLSRLMIIMMQAWFHFVVSNQGMREGIICLINSNAIWLLFALNPTTYTIQIIDLSRGLRHAVIAFSKIARVIFSHCRNNISFSSLHILRERERERLGKWDFWCKTIKEIIVSIVSHIIIAKNCSDGEKTPIYFFKKFAVVI